MLLSAALESAHTHGAAVTFTRRDWVGAVGTVHSKEPVLFTWSASISQLPSPACQKRLTLFTSPRVVQVMIWLPPGERRASPSVLVRKRRCKVPGPCGGSSMISQLRKARLAPSASRARDPEPWGMKAVAPE